jgi:Chlorophyll A-B binding protein
LEGTPSGFAAFENIDSNLFAQFGMTVIFMEMANRDQTGKAEFPGDFRNGALDFGWDNQSAEWKARKRAIELNNGRAAQMGILAIMVHEKLGNLDAIGLPQP